MRRLRRATVLVAVGGGALALGVADLAAKALPGRTTPKTVQAPPTTKAHSSQPTPPALVPAAQAAPAPPASAPAASSAPPVVASGGT